MTVNLPSLSATAVRAPSLRLDRLRLTNWRQITDGDIRFPNGLTGVTGPNGSGKTGLLRAILFAGYGMNAIESGKDSIPTRGRSGDTVVILDFSVGDVRYSVTRKLVRKSGDTKAELVRDGEVVSRNTANVTVEMDRILGSADDMLASRFVSQKQVASLSGLKPAQRKLVILHLLGIDAVETAIEALRARVTDADKTVKARRAVMPSVTAIRSDIDAAEADAAGVAARTRSADAALAKAEKALAAAEAEESAADTAASAAAGQAAALRLAAESRRDLDAEITAAAEAVSRLDAVAASLAEADERIAAIRAAGDEYTDAEAACLLRRRADDIAAERTALATAITSGRSRVASMTALAADAERLEQEAATAADDASSAAAAAATAEAERVSLRTALTRAREESETASAAVTALDAAGDGGTRCPTCDQAIGDMPSFRAHLADALAKARAEEASVLAAGMAAKAASETSAAARDAASARASDLRGRAAAARAGSADLRLAAADLAAREEQDAIAAAAIAEAAAIEHDEDRHTVLAADAAALPSLLTAAAGLRGRLEDRAAVIERAADLAARSTALAEREREAALAAAAAGLDPDRLPIARAALAAARAAHTAADRARLSLDGEAAVIAERRRSLDASMAEHGRLAADIASILADRSAVEMTRIEMDAFKVRLIGRIRPALSIKASALLRDLTDGRYADLDLDEDYQIWFGRPGLRKPITEASGGEEDLLNLCVRLAITEMITESKGIGATFIILDEVMGGQDDKRRSAILDLLPKLSSHFSQVLLVAHHAAVQDRFSQAIRLSFDEATETSTVVFPEAA